MLDDVVILDIYDLVEYAEQPFKVIDDYAMDALTQSVKMTGVLVLIIVRKAEDYKYKIISGTAGKELSFLDTRHQAVVNDYIEKEDCGVSIKQAKQVRACYEKGTLDEKNLNSIFIQEEQQEKFYLDFNKLRSYFPKSYTMQQCEDALWEMLDKMEH